MGGNLEDDVSPFTAVPAVRAAAARVNQLTGREVCEALKVDAARPDQVAAFLEDVDSFLSAVPYWLNPAIARAAVALAEA